MEYLDSMEFGKKARRVRKVRRVRRVGYIQMHQ